MLTLYLTAPDTNSEQTHLRAVQLPAAHGAWGIRPGHAEAFVTLTHGTIATTHADGTQSITTIPGGTCHIADNVVTVILHAQK